MAHLILAAFHNSRHADQAVRDLESLGYNPKEISFIGKEGASYVAPDDSPANRVVEGASSGAVAGGAIGGIAGLLAGAGVFPALAGLLIGGPIAALLGLTGAAATAVSGAVTGAVAGGLIGSLVGLGVPEETARYYEETVNEGGVVLAIPARPAQREEVSNLLESHHAEEVTYLDTSNSPSPPDAVGDGGTTADRRHR
jgi:uncharacterized membrane protein